MAAVAYKPTPNSYSQIDLRRHSSAHPSTATSSPPASHNGSPASTKSQPAWMSSIQDRDRQGSTASTPERGLKGFFGRKKAEPKKQESVVIGSKHAALVKNNLKVDPRGARKHQSVPTKTAGVQGTQKSAHTTAEEQETRHPHSGPPSVRGAADLPALTRIVSGDEEDEWERDKRRADYEKRRKPSIEKVVETHGEEEKATDIEFGGVEELQVRRKSLLDVEIKGGEGIKPQRRKTMFGAWAKDSNGVWTRA